MVSPPNTSPVLSDPSCHPFCFYRTADRQNKLAFSSRLNANRAVRDEGVAGQKEEETAEIVISEVQQSVRINNQCWPCQAATTNPHFNTEAVSLLIKISHMSELFFDMKSSRQEFSSCSAAL